MSTITYCKGLPIYNNQYNPLGISEFESFLNSYAPIFRLACIETVNMLLSECKSEFDGVADSAWNTLLQQKFKINKRHAGGVIKRSLGCVKSSIECRKNEIKQLWGKIKSIEKWLLTKTKLVQDSIKFYKKKNWQNSKTSCKLPLSCSLKHRGGKTNRGYLRFLIHNKKRKLNVLKKKLTDLKIKAVNVTLPNCEVYVVGSSDEPLGNRNCQWDGNVIRFRVPYCLENKFGKFVEINFGSFKSRKAYRLPTQGCKTWHFFRKNEKWVAAVQFTPLVIEPVSRHRKYGCLGIDINPGSIGWAYLTRDGNLKEFGQIPLIQGLPKGKMEQQLVDACIELVHIATKYACPIVREKLDFSNKKQQMKERGIKYRRMLSSWAYSRFFQLLDSIASNRGIEILQVNPAYTSLMGLVKYSKMYGLPSDASAAICIARRAMKLSERIPAAINAYLVVNIGKHVWSRWSKLNNIIKSRTEIASRHDYYSISNWGFLATPPKSDSFGGSRQVT